MTSKPLAVRRAKDGAERMTPTNQPQKSLAPTGLPVQQINKPLSLQEALLFPLGYREHHSTRVGLLAAMWTIIGILTLFAPTMFGLTVPLWTNLCSVFGALIISSAGIGTVSALYLRRSQQNETRQILAEDLITFQRETANAFLDRIEWVRSIEAAGIKNVVLSIPDSEIETALLDAKDQRIRLLFVSYAYITKYDKSICAALRNGCAVEVIIGDPKTNSYINFMEMDPAFQSNNERRYAEICAASVRNLRDTLPADLRVRFSLFFYDMPSSVVTIQIGHRYWFGVPWAHAQSFHGPWFEVRGDDKLLPGWLASHIDKVATCARKEP